MFDPLSFVLVIAQEVLAGVLLDFIKGARKSASRRDLERAAIQTMEQRGTGLGPSDLRRLSHQVMGEIEHFANQDPELDWRMRRLRPVPPIGPMPGEPARPDNEVLADRMRRLNALVTERRRALGLPLAPEPAAPPLQPAPASLRPAQPRERPVPGGEPFEIETVPLPTDAEYWKRRLDETASRIAKRRGDVESND